MAEVCGEQTSYLISQEAKGHEKETLVPQSPLSAPPHDL